MKSDSLGPGLNSTLEHVNTTSNPHASLAPQASLLFEYWTILKKHRWIVLSVIVLSVAMAALITVREKPMYSAVGRIAVNHESAVNIGTKEPLVLDESDGTDYSVDLETQIQVLESDAISYHVIKALQLDTSPEFGGSPSHPFEDTLRPDSNEQTAILGAFRGGLRIASVPATRVLEIHYSSHNPQLAAQVVNQLITSYIEQNLRARFEATAQTSNWLTKQLADLQMKVEVSQQKLVEYQKVHGIVGLGEKENVVTSKLQELNNSLTAVEGQRMQKEAAYHMALSGNPEILQQSSRDQVASPSDTLRMRESDLQTQLAAEKAQFGPNFPKVRELAAQVAEIENQIQKEQGRAVARAKSEYLESLEHEKVLRAAFERQKLEANDLNQNEIEYSLLKQNAESYRTLYDGLLQRLKEAGVSAGLKSSNIQIVDQARVPTAPYAPNLRRSLMGGFLAGCFLAMLTVFLFESLDNTVRTPEEAEQVSGLPTLGIIPSHRGSRAVPSFLARWGLTDPSPEAEIREILSITRPRSGIAESYRALRTSILLSSSTRPVKVLLITSSMPRDGKTTTSINTAAVLAQSGARVLLIDADLRRPSVHQTLRLPNQSGLSTWLAGTDKGAPHVLPSGTPNLDVLTTGPKPPYPAEMFGSPAFSEMVERFRSEYDHIVIDSPPVLSVTDAVLIAAHADSVLLVIRSHQTTKGALRRALDVLQQAKSRTIGVVLNAFNVNGEEYAYYRYYYGYGRSSEYYTEDESENSSTTVRE
jgi:capsular exopolysaccharide synthesis family protein